MSNLASQVIYRELIRQGRCTHAAPSEGTLTQIAALLEGFERYDNAIDKDRRWTTRLLRFVRGTERHVPEFTEVAPIAREFDPCWLVGMFAVYRAWVTEGRHVADAVLVFAPFIKEVDL